MSALPARPVVLVTGGARRIGRALCLAFARAGHDVAVHWHRSRDEAAGLTREVSALGVRSHAFQADLTLPGDVLAMAAAAMDHFGRIDVLVNNASQFRPTPFLLSSQEDLAADLDTFLTLHVRVPLALARVVAPAMAARGSGAIVNVGDADTVRPGYAPYAASKAALAALTRSLARELAPSIRVNMVAPGAILPAAGATDDAVAGIVARIPMARFGAVDEVARTAVFLATGPQFVTGQVVAVDGGQH